MGGGSHRRKGRGGSDGTTCRHESAHRRSRARGRGMGGRGVTSPAVVVRRRRGGAPPSFPSVLAAPPPPFTSLPPSARRLYQTALASCRRLEHDRTRHSLDELFTVLPKGV